MPVISEIVTPEHARMFAEYADIMQIGARNMQNFELLKTVGALHKPVLLKRGPAATIQDLLMSAEYLLAHGTDSVMLCERGIRTFETYTRNTLDISAIPVVKIETSPRYIHRRKQALDNCMQVFDIKAYGRIWFHIHDSFGACTYRYTEVNIVDTVGK